MSGTEDTRGTLVSQGRRRSSQRDGTAGTPLLRLARVDRCRERRLVRGGAARARVGVEDRDVAGRLSG